MGFVFKCTLSNCFFMKRFVVDILNDGPSSSDADDENDAAAGNNKRGRGSKTPPTPRRRRRRTRALAINCKDITNIALDDQMLDKPTIVGRSAAKQKVIDRLFLNYLEYLYFHYFPL